MKSLSSTEKILLALLGIVVIFYLYYGFYMNPMLQKRSASEKNIKKYEEDINSSKNIAKENEKLKLQIADLTAKSAEQDKLLPKSERQPEYIKDIKAAADKNSITINAISFGKAKEVTVDSKNASNQNNNQQNSSDKNNQTSSNASKQNTAVNAVYTSPLSISITGDYKSIVAFVSAAENGNRFTDISSLNIAAQDKTISANININYYYSNVLAKKDITYDFNKGSYGKDDLFK